MFYFLLDGDCVEQGDSDENATMSGRIVSFADFLRMDTDGVLAYDILLGAAVGKREILEGRQVVSKNNSHSFNIDDSSAKAQPWNTGNEWKISRPKFHFGPALKSNIDTAPKFRRNETWITYPKSILQPIGPLRFLRLLLKGISSLKGECFPFRCVIRQQLLHQ